jgi:hypothetical protein
LNVLGTKCQCDVCRLQVVVIKGGAGSLMCHGVPMSVIAGGTANGEERLNASARPDGGKDEDVEYF